MSSKPGHPLTLSVQEGINAPFNIFQDLRVHVLENVEGGIDALLHRESQWMSRLGTHEPMGLNSSCNELGRIHCKLFSKTN